MYNLCFAESIHEIFTQSFIKNISKRKPLAVPIPGYGDWWIFMCGQSSCINCNMTGCFPDKSIWFLIGHVCQESKVI